MKRWVGIDLHKNCFTVCYLSQGGKRELREYKVSGTGIEAFRGTLKKSDEVAVESTGNTGYFVGEIRDLVKVVKVINPSQFKIISSSIKKTDEHDAEFFSEFDLDLGINYYLFRQLGGLSCGWRAC
jgi:transposase